LFEQASSRGHAQQTQNGLLSFPFTIRNQFVTALSTLEAGKALRKELLDYQRSFFMNIRSEAAAAPVKAYVFGDAYDASRNHLFIEMLKRHQIQVYEAKQAIDADGKKFNVGSAWVVPTAQPQYKLVKTIFEKTLNYEDSLFYDITSWTFPLAMGIPYGELKILQPGVLGDAVTAASFPAGKITGSMSKYAYAFDWDDFYAPKLLYALQSKGILTKAATQLFESTTAAGKRRFNYGAILVPVHQQRYSPEVLYQQIESALAGTGVEVFSLNSGLSISGIDLGSGSFQNLRMPSVMLMGGAGTSSNDCGEIWHLLDQRMRIPATMVEVERLSGVTISGYNVIIMPEGNYGNMEKSDIEKLRNWVSNGGTLIALEGAGKFLSSAGLTRTLYRNAESRVDSNAMYPYYLRSDETRAREMAGSIFEAKIDPTHPLCYGYRTSNISVFKANTLFMDQNNNPYDSPVLLTDQPLQSGYLHRSYKDKLSRAAIVNTENIGRGKVITFSDNTNFRAFWFGTMKLFMNAIFF